ncbi:MAG: UvrD-helicase domain-containing protein [Elusimicrobia bacterium]|nr:UvrD-helicase domain-containing protein [Elusimicrobiota bacterium]
MRLPSDQASRDIIRDKLGDCVWVEAGAGSGKTTELVTRLVNLIVRKQVPLSEIAAITFTRKAAAELKTRVQDAIEKAYREEKDPRRKQSLDAALSTLDALFAETIHAFCMQLLRERPLEAGVPPDFDLMERAEEASVQAAVLQRALDRLRKERSSEWEELRRAGLGPRQLSAAFGTLCDHAEVDFPTGDAKAPDFGALAKGLQGLVEAWDRLAGGPFDIKERVLYDAYAEVKRLVTLEDPPPQDSILSALRVFNRKVEPKAKSKNCKGWRDPDARRQAEELFVAFRDGTAQRELARWHAYLYGRALRVLLPAREETLEERLKLGRLAQGDLLRLAARMLRENPEVRAHLAKRYKYLFVDEFQDTDPVQAELMLLLTGDSPSSDWTKQKPRAGSLFVVGDPKQSIYRFRRADIAVYKQVKEIMVAAGALQAPLTASFRSQPAVCDWINSGFKGRILPEEASERQAPFASLDPMRVRPKGYGAGVYALDIPDQGKQDRIAPAEADAISKYIRHAIDSGQTVEDGKGDDVRLRPVRPGDFMIIARGKKFLAAYAGALDRLGIPNEVVATDRGGAWEGLGILISILKAVADPDDELAVVACLRGPLFGVSDDELYRHKKAGGSFRLTRKAEQEGPAARALNVLHECWLVSRRKPAGLALELILERTGLLASVRLQEDGPAHAADILAVVSFVRELGLAGETLASALEALEAEFEDNKGENIGRPPLNYGGDKVRIMNLHKAKGLEARFVFLTQPAMKTDHPPEIHIRRQGTKVEGFFPIQVKAGWQKRTLAAPEAWEPLKLDETAFQRAEADRLHYVAVTRAQDYLILTRYAGKIRENFKVFGPLLDLSEDIKPLPVPAQATSPKAAKSASLTSRDDASKSRAAAVSAKAAPSYELESVTDRVKDNAFDPAEADWGSAKGPRGMEWGVFIHKALETLVRSGETPKSKEIERLLVALAGPGTPYAAQAANAVPLIASALKSEVWSRMLASPERHTEVPFQATEGATVLSGAIDLIYRVDGGWEIIDFKTDNVGSDCSAWVTRYRPQLAEYAKWWEAITGERVRRTGLLFVQAGAVEWV